MIALVAVGHQDAYTKGNPTLFDARKLLLGSDRHSVTYSKLPVIAKKGKTYDGSSRTVWIMQVSRSCDLIGHVDLVIRNPDAKPVSRLVRSVEVILGGHRIDKLYNLDVTVDTNCALFRNSRRINHINGLTFVPLEMAPFHETDLVFPSAKYHDLEIVVELEQDDADPIELYANRYYLNNDGRRRLSDSAHCFVTVQNQYRGPDKVVAGVNRVRLNFNHPVHLIYFWTMQIVRHVRLLLNEKVFFDGPVEVLVNFKAAKGFANVKPHIIFFNQGPITGHDVFGTVNFSCIDDPILEIETATDSTEGELHVVGLNLQPLRYAGGMVGLVFSK